MDAKGVSGTEAGCAEDGLLDCWDPCPSVCMLDSGVNEGVSTSLKYSENKASTHLYLFTMILIPTPLVGSHISFNKYFLYFF